MFFIILWQFHARTNPKNMISAKLISEFLPEASRGYSLCLETLYYWFWSSRENQWKIMFHHFLFFFIVLWHFYADKNSKISQRGMHRQTCHCYGCVRIDLLYWNQLFRIDLNSQILKKINLCRKIFKLFFGSWRETKPALTANYSSEREPSLYESWYEVWGVRYEMSGTSVVWGVGHTG